MDQTPRQASSPNPDEVYSAFDDLKVVGRSLEDNDALTLTAVMRNEMFFLPAFFDHYRKLGVERFVVIEDKSTDESLDFLASQPDCMVLHSNHSFNEQHPLPSRYVYGSGRHVRMCTLWANILVRRYGMNRWMLHMDADEFLRIPDGMRIQDLALKLDAMAGRAVLTMMIDLYPATIEELHRQSSGTRLDIDGAWYFDACQHARFSDDGSAKYVYGGSRSRLANQFGIRQPDASKHFNPLKLIRRNKKKKSYNAIHKKSLMKMSPEGFLYNTHWSNLPMIEQLMLPLEHFKFNGQLLKRTEAALERKSHADNSREYEDMSRLIEVMTRAKASFLDRCSSADRSFGQYRRAGIAQGIEMLE